MKRKGHISQTYIKRDRDVLPMLYRRAKQQADYPTSVDKIFNIMSELPTDRFYIADDAALFYVRKRYFHNEEVCFRTPQKQKLFNALYDEVLLMMQEEKYKALGLQATTICALMRPAPCVGLSPVGISKIFRRRKKEGCGNSE